MKKTQKYLEMGLFFVAFFLFLNHANAESENLDFFDSKSQRLIIKGVAGQQIRIVPQLNKLNFGLGRFDDTNFYYRKTLSKIFFQDHIIHAKVTKVKFDGTQISMKLFHPVLGTGTIQFVFDEDLLTRIPDDALQNILLTTIADENHLYVFADPNSKIFHLYSCLHTKDESKLLRLTKEEAKQEGYRQCEFCFKKVLYIPNLAIELEIEKEWSERLRDYEPLMDGSARHQYLRNLGQRVLRNWPFQLFGYNYSFQLIKSSRMNAIAIPTGKIVVSTALMEALENETEVEALLVIAIAHIERRHSLKQYWLKTAMAKDSTTMQSFMKAAGSVAGIFPGGNLIGTIGSMSLNKSSGNKSSVLRFDDDFNIEADAIAALYFELNHENKESLSSLVRKMQIAELSTQLHPEFGNGSQDLNFNERIKRVENTKFKHFGGRKSFVLKRKKSLPIQLDFIYQSIFDQENRLIAYISDKSLLPPTGVRSEGNDVSLLIKDENGRQKYKLHNKLSTEDLWGAQLTFEVNAEKQHQFIEEIETIQLIVESPMGHVENSEEQPVEYFQFIEGKLDY